VVAGAKSAGVVGRHGEAWKVRVHAAPEAGRANEAVVRLLAETLGLPRSGVALVSGHARPDKIIELAGITEAESDRRLAAAERKRAR
jgi:uncharacterized protein YggU (UPF0235/DUF167 family)